MTVEQLIEKLREFPPYRTVWAAGRPIVTTEERINPTDTPVITVR